MARLSSQNATLYTGLQIATLLFGSHISLQLSSLDPRIAPGAFAVGKDKGRGAH